MLVSSKHNGIYARSSGTARIYAVSKVDPGKSDYITVTVTSGTIYVTSVELNRSYVSIEEGETFTLSATICPINASNKSLAWSSSNTSIATVSSSGKVTAKSRGYVTITATAKDGSGRRDCCEFYVTGDVLVGSITVSPSYLELTKGESRRLYETVCPTNASNKCVRWSSSNTNIVFVNPDSGLVYAQNAGTSTITVTATDGSGKKGTCTVNVNPPIAVTDVLVCPQTKTLNVGQTAKLNVTVCPYNATNKRVTWCSSNDEVACVNYYSISKRFKRYSLDLCHMGWKIKILSRNILFNIRFNQF